MILLQMFQTRTSCQAVSGKRIEAPLVGQRGATVPVAKGEMRKHSDFNECIGHHQQEHDSEGKSGLALFDNALVKDWLESRIREICTKELQNLGLLCPREIEKQCLSGSLNGTIPVSCGENVNHEKSDKNGQHRIRQCVDKANNVIEECVDEISNTAEYIQQIDSNLHVVQTTSNEITHAKETEDVLLATS